MGFGVRGLGGGGGGGCRLGFGMVSVSGIELQSSIANDTVKSSLLTLSFLLIHSLQKVRPV